MMPLPTRRDLIASFAATGIGTATGTAMAKSKHAAEPWSVLPPTPPLPGPVERRCLDVDGTCIFHARFGPADAPAVLLLHGGLGSSDYWGHQAAYLARRFSVHVMDTRGHGRSPVTSRDFGYAVFARDVVALLHALKLDKVAVVGWSDGAVTGLQLAMDRPERVSRLFAFGANASPDGMIPNGARSRTFAEYGRRCRSEYATLSPDPKRWPQLVSGLRAMWAREPHFSRERLAAIRAPTVVADGAHDEIIRADHTQQIAEAIPGAKHVVMPRVSHFAMLQDPAQFNEALSDFLA